MRARADTVPTMPTELSTYDVVEVCALCSKVHGDAEDDLAMYHVMVLAAAYRKAHGIPYTPGRALPTRRRQGL